MSQPGRQDDADYSVLTPERVSLHYDVAGIGSRGTAAMLDTVIQSLIMLVLGAGGLALTVLAQRNLPRSVRDDLTIWVVVALVVAVFLVTVGYQMIFEIVWSGQTPGKRAMHLRVIRENGYPLRAGDAVVRNLIRIIDSLPSGYVVGLLVMLLNGRAKRLGDFAAGTIVVREAARQSLSHIAAAQPSTTAVRISAEDAALVRDFLQRRASLTDVARERLATRIAEVVARRNGLDAQLAEQGSENFLQELGRSELG